MIHICLYSFGEDLFLEKCLNSIKTSNIDNYFIDLYIFNNKLGSNFDKYKFQKNIDITILDKPKNYSWVTNKSLKKAKSLGFEYFLLLNTDTIIRNDCLPNLTKPFLIDKNIGIVGGYQTEYYGDWNAPNLWTRNNVIESQGVSYSVGSTQLTLFKTYYTQGACMIFKTELVDQVGYFNEKFVLFYEETEFCRRARMSGYLVVVLKEAKVKHYSGASWKKNKLLNIKRDLYYFSNQIIFESTENANSYKSILKNILYVVKKQIKNIRKREDDVKISLLLYPVVIILLLLRIDLLLSVYKK